MLPLRRQQPLASWQASANDRAPPLLVGSRPGPGMGLAPAPSLQHPPDCCSAHRLLAHNVASRGSAALSTSPLAPATPPCHSPWHPHARGPGGYMGGRRRQAAQAEQWGPRPGAGGAGGDQGGKGPQGAKAGFRVLGFRSRELTTHHQRRRLLAAVLVVSCERPRPQAPAPTPGARAAARRDVEVGGQARHGGGSSACTSLLLLLELGEELLGMGPGVGQHGSAGQQWHAHTTLPALGVRKQTVCPLHRGSLTAPEQGS